MQNNKNGNCEIELPKDYDYSQCFGIPAFCERLDPECYLCEYITACRVACNRRTELMGHVSLANTGDFIERIALHEENTTTAPDEYDNKDTLCYSTNDLIYLMEFFLRTDEYTLKLVSEILTGNATNVAELARREGVSRQAVHAKLQRACKRTPELKAVLMGNLTRCKRIVRGDPPNATYSARHSRQRTNGKANSKATQTNT